MFIKVPHRTSDCVECMYVNPITGVIQVALHKGNVYEHTEVSRKAIINLLLNRQMSLGLWYNHNVQSAYSKHKQMDGETFIIPCVFASGLPHIA